MAAPITATLYAADGSSSSLALTGSLGRQWLDELNATGSGTLRLPITDSAVTSCDYDKVIKFTYSSAERFGFVIEQMTWGVVGEAGSRYLEVSGRGMLSWLEAALLLPAGGTVAFTSPDKRWFNFASADAYSHSFGVTWGTPVGVTWSARSDNVAGYPKDWPDHSAEWIWSTDPQTSTTAGTTNWFQQQFTLAADSPLRLFASADNYADVYVDGDLVLSMQDAYSWRKAGTADLTLTAGTHVIAIRGQNQSAPAPAYNPASVIASLMTLDTSGNPVAIVAHTSTAWRVSTTEPKWTAGDVLYTVVTEAQSFGWGHLSAITLDFTATTDSNGATWSTTVSRSWDIVTTNLLTLVSDLCELGIDVWMTPDRVLHAAETRGAVKSVTLTSASTVSGWKISGQRAVGTYGWVRTELGWINVQDAAGVAAHGKVGLALQTGNSDSDATASQVAAAAFTTMAAPLETVTDTALVPASGATAYVDFGVGDTITGLNKTGAGASVRLLSLTVQEDDAGVVTYTPEFAV